MKFIRTLWGQRRSEQSASVSERIAAYTRLTPPSALPVRNVTAAPARPPLREDKRA